jgi:hypothetical protein
MSVQIDFSSYCGRRSQGKRNYSSHDFEFHVVGGLRVALLHWRAHSAICSSLLAESSSEAEESIHKAYFSRRSGFEHEALPLADNEGTPLCGEPLFLRVKKRSFALYARRFRAIQNSFLHRRAKRANKQPTIGAAIPR